MALIILEVNFLSVKGLVMDWSLLLRFYPVWTPLIDWQVRLWFLIDTLITVFLDEWLLVVSKDLVRLFRLLFAILRIENFRSVWIQASCLLTAYIEVLGLFEFLTLALELNLSEKELLLLLKLPLLIGYELLVTHVLSFE